MHDDLKLSRMTPQAPSSARALRRVAEALGVPETSFLSVNTDAMSKSEPFASEEAAVLMMVQSYLTRATPAMRERFVVAIQVMTEGPPT